MGIIYNRKVVKSYLGGNIFDKLVSQSKSLNTSTSKYLTRENIIFLQSLGLRLKHKKFKRLR